MNRETIKWSPFALPKNNEDFCVLVYLVDKVYEFYLFDGFIKRFTNATLPKELSKNLTMIKALGVPILKNERGLRELKSLLENIQLLKILVGEFLPMCLYLC